jgi:DNA-directed RNA polymerase specialized sigma subunit
VKELPVEEIAPLLGISRRQCFRRRAQAIRKLIDLGEPPRAA